MITTGAIFLLVAAIALVYAVARIWRRGNDRDGADGMEGFRPRIGFTRLDGMVSLSLLLENDASRHVWAEEIEIFLGDLKAEQQASEAACRGIRKIRQMVLSGDLLPISLCETIYKAAGDPQRKYSCVLSSVLRYRIGEKCFEKNMDHYKIRMVGLMASDIHRDRKYVPPVPAQMELRNVPTMAAKLK
jgi:hypothetical protein